MVASPDFMQTQLGTPDVQAFGGQQASYQQLTQALNASALPPLPADNSNSADAAPPSADADEGPPTAPTASAGPPPVSASQAKDAVSDIVSQSKKQQGIDAEALDKIGADERRMSDLDYDYLKSQEQWNPPVPPQADFNPMQRMAPLLFLAAFGGKLTKLDANAMLGATAGTIDGFLKGDQQKLQNSQKQYDEAYQQYQDRRAQQKEIYDTLRTSYKDMLDGDLRALQAAHEMTGDQINVDQQLLNLREHWEQIDATMKERQAAQESTNWFRRAELKQRQDAQKASQPADSMTDDEMRTSARYAIAGGKDPTFGLSAKNPARDRYNKIKSEEITAMGGPKAAITSGIETHAERQSVAQLTTMLGATRQAVSQLEFHIDQSTQILKKLPGTNLSPLINAMARGEEKWTGDPKYYALYTEMYGVATESARILSGGQASRAQLHEGAAQEAQKWANINMTPASFITGVAPQLIKDGNNRIVNFTDAISAQENAPPTASAPMGGSEKTVVGTGMQDGRKVLKFSDGSIDWAP